MNQEFHQIVPPRNLRQSPVRGGGIPPPSQRLNQPSGISRLQPPGSGLRPPSGTTGLRPGIIIATTTTGLQPPGSGLRPPSGTTGFQPPGSGLRPPSGTTGLRPPLSGIRPPVSGLRPPSRPADQAGIRPPSQLGAIAPPSGLRPPSQVRPQTIGEIVQPPPKLIPIPGEPKKLGAIPRPASRIPGPGKARIVVPVTRSVSTTSLLPKPSFMLAAQEMQRVASGQSRLPPPGSRILPPGSIASQTPQAARRPYTEPVTPISKVPVMLPRTATKKRITTTDKSAETYNIAGRDVEFVEYVPSPESPPYVPWEPSHHPLVVDTLRTPRMEQTPRQRAVMFESAAELEFMDEPAPKRYVFADEPSVINAKEFQAKLRADLERSRKMVADMEALYEQKSAALARLKAKMEEQERSPEPSPQEPSPQRVDVEAFREKYGITQSPTMRQLLEVTGEWNRQILEKQQFEESVAKADKTFAKKERIRRVPTLEALRETEEDDPAVEEARRLQFQQARQARIDEFNNRKKSQEEYRRVMEDRKQNIASRRPYSKQEREEIRKQYQDAQEWTYTTPTKKALDNALKMAKIMELEETGISMHCSPDQTVGALFPEAAPTAEITGVVGDVLIPTEISVEKLNTINSLDRGTIEVALKASLVPAPPEDLVKNILEASLQEMATTIIEPAPQPLDPMYEIDLKLDRPKRQNYVQLQGSSLPAWFPGYYSIFPGAPGLVQVMKSPSSTLLTAWRKIQSSIAAEI